MKEKQKLIQTDCLNEFEIIRTCVNQKNPGDPYVV